MDKTNFLSGLYNEFARNITWPKWSDLQSSTMVVALSTLILAVILYGIDEIFIWFLQKIFSIRF
ncbi:preprotein translocase subunit SecE [Bacteroidetes bacterium endosymbiont of Geopemphigus sp.]|uniref:preprotein translocase subunit SecE n=1 Tax=Bacteroidetes bacterium endosymbiont of Geopemphigus sp. TaxID=2047937 RepID=UPI000CD0B5E9|nr:preprotein translocase subunit SecE [Bacteroidetes bacterium endosymbiont of Geopemphigus sp.]